MPEFISHFLMGALVQVVFQGVPRLGHIRDYDMKADEYMVEISRTGENVRYSQEQVRKWNFDYVKGK